MKKDFFYRLNAPVHLFVRCNRRVIRGLFQSISPRSIVHPNASSGGEGRQPSQKIVGCSGNQSVILPYCLDY